MTIRVAVVPTRAARTSWATWAAVRPTMIALFGSGVTWISGVPLDRSDLRLSRSALSARAARTASLAVATSAALSPETMTLRLFEVKPGRLRDRDVVAVGLDRREGVREVLASPRSGPRVLEDDRDPGAVRGPPALGGDDGLEAGVALARDGRSGRARRSGRRRGSASASIVRSRTACVLVPGGGATVTWRIFSEPALMNAVGQERGQRAGHDEQDERPPGPRRPWSSGCGARP